MWKSSLFKAVDGTQLIWLEHSITWCAVVPLYASAFNFPFAVQTITAYNSAVVVMKVAIVVCIAILSLHSIRCIDDTNDDGNRINSNSTAGSVMGIDNTNSGGNGIGDGGGNGTNSVDGASGMASDKSGDDENGDADATEVCNKTFTIPKGIVRCC